MVLFRQLVDAVIAASRDTRTGGATFSVSSGPFQSGFCTITCVCIDVVMCDLVHIVETIYHLR